MLLPPIFFHAAARSGAHPPTPSAMIEERWRRHAKCTARMRSENAVSGVDDGAERLQCFRRSCYVMASCHDIICYSEGVAPQRAAVARRVYHVVFFTPLRRAGPRLSAIVYSPDKRCCGAPEQPRRCRHAVRPAPDKDKRCPPARQHKGLSCCVAGRRGAAHRRSTALLLMNRAAPRARCSAAVIKEAQRYSGDGSVRQRAQAMAVACHGRGNAAHARARRGKNRGSSAAECPLFHLTV